MSEKTRFWIVTVAAVAAMMLTSSLGRWQMGRADEKLNLQAQIDARDSLPPIAAVGLKDMPKLDDLLHRRVVAQGTWLTAQTVFLDNRQMNGRPGMYVVTPLRLHGSDAVVLVQRGWVQRNFQDRTRVPDVATAGGVVQVEGHLAPPPSKLYELGTAETGMIRQNLDVSAYARETGLPLLSVSIQQNAPASDGLTRDWHKIDTGVAKHHGYAFQWFGLSALIAALYVWFQIVRRLQRRPR